VLAVFKRHRIVSIVADGTIRLLDKAYLPKGRKVGLHVYASLSSLQGLAETCYENIRDKSRRGVRLLHRYAYTERFDPQRLRKFDKHLKDVGSRFLELQNDWLKRNEKTERGSRGRQLGNFRDRPEFERVGVGLYGMVGF
jgi:hypothetical protein